MRYTDKIGRREFIAVTATLALGGCKKHIDDRSTQTADKIRKSMQSEPQNTERVETLTPPSIETALPPALSYKAHDKEEYIQSTATVDANTGTPLTGARWFQGGTEGWYVDWNAERSPLKGIVIHHLGDETLEKLAHTDPQELVRRINDHHRETTYARRYASAHADPFVRGLPVHSGNVVRKQDEENFRETYVPYHHFILPDGSLTTEINPLLPSENNGIPRLDMVGWHSGDWQTNCSHVGICLAGNYVGDAPGERQYDSLKRLIAYYQTHNPALTIQPHSQLSATECPGQAWWQTWEARNLTEQGIPKFKPAE